MMTPQMPTALPEGYRGAIHDAIAPKINWQKAVNMSVSGDPDDEKRMHLLAEVNVPVVERRPRHAYIKQHTDPLANERRKLVKELGKRQYKKLSKEWHRAKKAQA